MKEMWMIYRLKPLSLSFGKETYHCYWIPKEGEFESKEAALQRLPGIMKEDELNQKEVSDSGNPGNRLLYAIEPYYEKEKV